MLVFVALALITASPSPGFAEVSVYFDGDLKAVRFPPILRNGRALVHVRETFVSLGAVVRGSYGESKVEAWRGDSHILLEEGKSFAFVNGKRIALDQPPIVHSTAGGKGLMVPIRFVSTALQAKVTYTSDSNRVDINTSAMPFLHEKPPFKPGSHVQFLLAGKYAYVSAKVMSVRDWPKSEDQYKIEYRDKSGRKLTPTVGRRYLKKG